MNRPFDEAKYKRLLDGLEITEIELSVLEESRRLDAEYYQRKFLKMEHVLSCLPNQSLGMLGSFLTGPFGSEFNVENYISDAIYRYVRGKDVKPFFLKDDDNVYIPEADFKRLSKYSLHLGDILVSVVGTLGNASIVTESTSSAIFSCKSTVFHSKAINPFYLIAYLNCSYGHSLLLRKTRGTVQAGINIEDLSSLLVFTPSNQLQINIEALIHSSFEKLKQSKALYAEAENLLLDELGLHDWQPSAEQIAVKTFQQSFLQTGRLDAEYYQPKYDELLKRLAALTNGNAWKLCSLGSMSDPLHYGSSTKLEYINQGVPFLRLLT